MIFSIYELRICIASTFSRVSFYWKWILIRFYSKCKRKINVPQNVKKFPHVLSPSLSNLCFLHLLLFICNWLVTSTWQIHRMSLRGFDWLERSVNVCWSDWDWGYFSFELLLFSFYRLFPYSNVLDSIWYVLAFKRNLRVECFLLDFVYWWMVSGWHCAVVASNIKWKKGNGKWGRMWGRINFIIVFSPEWEFLHVSCQDLSLGVHCHLFLIYKFFATFQINPGFRWNSGMMAFLFIHILGWNTSLPAQD